MKDYSQGQPQQSESAHLRGIDYVELYVGNARHAAHFYCAAFGFKLLAYAGPETGVRDRVSFVVEQGNIRLALTSPMTSEGLIAEHFNLHGDGVKDIALSVDDATAAFEQTVERGARPVAEPAAFEDQHGRVVKASIATFGDTLHSFVQREQYGGAFLPGYRAVDDAPATKSTGLVSIDHIAVGVETGKANHWVEYYEQTLGLDLSQQEDISSEYSGMNTKVVENRSGSITFVIVEPVPGKRKSPIDEYLMYYGSAGVHHIATLSKDIVSTVAALRASGVEFARTPDTYYDTLEKRVGSISENTAALREQNILVDRDEWGYLMQIFLKPTQTRPTFFFEIIQRKRARGFGNGNIKALFEAIEREQMLRGNV